MNNVSMAQERIEVALKALHGEFESDADRKPYYEMGMAGNAIERAIDAIQAIKFELDARADILIEKRGYI